MVLDTSWTVLARWTAGVPAGISVTPDDWKAAVDRRLELEPREATRQHLTRVLAEIPAPKAFPAIDEILVDHANLVWIRTFEQYNSPTASWLIVEPASGRAVGRAALPRVLRVLEIGLDYLLGMRRDADGVEQVVVHPIQRQG